MSSRSLPRFILDSGMSFAGSARAASCPLPVTHRRLPLPSLVALPRKATAAISRIYSCRPSIPTSSPVEGISLRLAARARTQNA